MKSVSNFSNLLRAAMVAAVLPAAVASAQTAYTAIDLTAAGSFGTAYAISSGQAFGYSAVNSGLAVTRATGWTPAGPVDLHPSFLDDAVTGVSGRSSILGASGGIQVGWGAGVSTGNRALPVAWSGSSASATALAVPFVNAGGQATATDGRQIVGYATALNRDGTTFGPSRSVLWDSVTGAATDLGDGGNGAQALGVGGGKQVGYTVKGNINAVLWSGSSKSLLVIHPKNAVTSVAYGTDGKRQVGYSGYDVRVRVEAVNGNKDARFNYATVWTGTATSAAIIHPYPFQHSYAVAVTDAAVAGYAADQSKIGTPAYFHAIVWDANYQATDLNAFLPAGFIGSQAFSVDQQGNVAGVMTSADGQRHAVVWVPNP